MREVALPSADLPPLTRSVVACLASILEADPREVPAPPAEHPAPWTVWHNWLATRGLGLVPIHAPQSFDWPGPWVALLRSGVAAVAFGAPPGLAWAPLGGSFEDVVAGHVVAPADVALWAPRAAPTDRVAGRVEAIVLAADAEGPATVVEQARAVAGRGLEGDRYFDGRGTFSDWHGRGHQLTLVEAEVLDELGLAPGDVRRNVVTRGIDLKALVGRTFRIGEVECIGQRLCEPCAHLERLTPGTLRPLVRRGGLRADILSGGTLATGDPVAQK